MPAAPPIYVAPPLTRPYPYGLMSVVDPFEDASLRWQNGVEYQSAACLDVKIAPDACAGVGDRDKEFHDEIPVTSGEPFTAYTGTMCGPFGRSLAESVDLVRTALTLGESRAVEEHVLATILATTDAVDLTPADGAVHPVAGVASLEGYAGERYGGVPTLHVPRTVASYLDAWDTLSTSGNQLVTGLGSLVAAGGGYAANLGPDGTPAPDGEAWIYAAGAVNARRGPVFTSPPEADLGAMLDKVTNELVVLAERTYVVTVECFIAAVRVTLDCP